MKTGSMTTAVLLAWGAAVGPIMAAASFPPFQLADSDGNGFVDREEARRAGLEESVFEKADRDRDARLVTWEYRELKQSAVRTSGNNNRGKVGDGKALRLNGVDRAGGDQTD